MDIFTKTIREKVSDSQQTQEVQSNPWPDNAMQECKNCIAFHEYPEGMCCTVQAEQYGKPYLIKDMEKCPGLPTLPRRKETE